jgi:hypothetical protein
MKTRYVYLFAFLAAALLFSCSKKVHPVTTTAAAPSPVKSTADTMAVKKVIVKKKIKEPVPKVISVNDLSAKKTVDGRLYYDLEGHRYWRNKKDGKYYLYNKAMYENEDFKP